MVRDFIQEVREYLGITDLSDPYWTDDRILKKLDEDAPESISELCKRFYDAGGRDFMD